MVIGIGLTPITTDAIGYIPTAIIYGVVSMAVILYMAFGVREPETIKMEKAKLIPAILSIIKSKNFWIVGFANAFYSAAMGLVMAAIVFYVKYALGLGSLQETILLGIVILGGIRRNFLSALARKFGSIPIWRAALITLTVAFLPLFFANSFVTAILGAICVGIGFSGCISTMDPSGRKSSRRRLRQARHKARGHILKHDGLYEQAVGLVCVLGMFLASRIYGFERAITPAPALTRLQNSFFASSRWRSPR